VPPGSGGTANRYGAHRCSSKRSEWKLGSQLSLNAESCPRTCERRERVPEVPSRRPFMCCIAAQHLSRGDLPAESKMAPYDDPVLSLSRLSPPTAISARAPCDPFGCWGGAASGRVGWTGWFTQWVPIGLCLPASRPVCPVRQGPPALSEAGGRFALAARPYISSSEQPTPNAAQIGELESRLDAFQGHGSADGSESRGAGRAGPEHLARTLWWDRPPRQLLAIFTSNAC